jgi:hypothetical protein
VVKEPPRALPSWVAPDFQCPAEPAAPAKETTKGDVELYIAGLLGWGRECKTKLNARGDDAKRYDMIGTPK